jgi:hypothetical protein
MWNCEESVIKICESHKLLNKGFGLIWPLFIGDMNKANPLSSTTSKFVNELRKEQTWGGKQMLFDH